MQPNNKWINDWLIGEDTAREKDISTRLLDFFLEFWAGQKLDNKSKKTQNRYSNALHALGGFIVERAVSDDEDMTFAELLSQHIYPDEGPLIFQDHEGWQGEVDLVCRKLYKYMNK